MATLKIKRVYEPVEKNDGVRILVDRLWPRGLKKESAHIDEWLKDIAPSTELRKWFDHDPAKWNEFNFKYSLELKQNGKIDNLIELVKKAANVTLLYSARDEQHNQAIVLLEFINTILK
jgi:uncharacterized protein YeaO (DUF488 family)